ncbi:MAG TPA: thermonuclease family protein [Phycisphaerae bacterium]|nr:thermonuclease family protein [Phycisphaerae bacterium]
MSFRRASRALILPCALACFAAGAAFVEDIIGSKSGKVYHLYPTECATARKINPENMVRFSSAAQAEGAGRHLCKTCEKIRAKRLAEQAGGKSDPKSGHTGGARPGRDKPTPTTQTAAADPVDTPVVPQFARVTAVLPGGTLDLDVGEKVRLLGVVCPSDGQPLAKEAVRFVEEQTRGRTVRLSLDSSAGPLGHRDALGRLAVYLAPQPDGRDLGGELIFQGYAWFDREARFDRQSEYARREEEAWRDQRGIWKPLEADAGKIEVVTGRFATSYHDPKCPHVSLLAGKISMTLNEAKSRRLPPCPLYKARRAVEQSPRNQPPAAPQPTSRPSESKELDPQTPQE